MNSSKVNDVGDPSEGAICHTNMMQQAFSTNDCL